MARSGRLHLQPASELLRIPLLMLRGEKGLFALTRYMCQGLSSCGARQICNKELRCGISFRQFPHSSGKIKTLNTSQVKHSFCQYHWNKGDRSYSSIDRSDENITNTINIKESPIDYSYLKPCNKSDFIPGVTCYETANQSDRPPCNSVSIEWCRAKRGRPRCAEPE